jgi:hypothetical protein
MTTQPVTTQSVTTGSTNAPTSSQTKIIIIIVVVVVSLVAALLVILIVVRVRAVMKKAASATLPASVQALPKVGQPRRYGNWLPEAPGSLAALMHRYPDQSPPVMRWYAANLPPAAAYGPGVALPHREPVIVVRRAPFGQMRNPPYFATPSGYFYRPGRLIMAPRFG